MKLTEMMLNELAVGSVVEGGYCNFAKCKDGRWVPMPPSKGAPLTLLTMFARNIEGLFPISTPTLQDAPAGRWESGDNDIWYVDANGLVRTDAAVGWDKPGNWLLAENAPFTYLGPLEETPAYTGPDYTEKGECPPRDHSLSQERQRLKAERIESRHRWQRCWTSMGHARHDGCINSSAYSREHYANKGRVERPVTLPVRLGPGVFEEVTKMDTYLSSEFGGSARFEGTEEGSIQITLRAGRGWSYLFARSASTCDLREEFHKLVADARANR